jgi:hypothetical protein
MGLPYDVKSELPAIHQEKLTADGADPSEEERLIVLEHRAEQFGLILGRRLREKLQPLGVDAQQMEKVSRILFGAMPDDGTVLNLEESIDEVLIEARAEFRELIGL